MKLYKLRKKYITLFNIKPSQLNGNKYIIKLEKLFCSIYKRLIQFKK